MSILIVLLIAVVIIVLAVYLINLIADARTRQVLYIVVIIFTIIWAVKYFGLV